jgi:single-stranded-DNA-specific exonuclease
MVREIKNLKKVAQRIQKAIKNQEKIILYGDADLDGASSVIILEETIKNLGGQIVTIYFPDREEEGYGLNEKALDYLKKFSPALLITLDCGIGNFKETELAKKLGFEVIIIDHHEVLEELPKAKIIVDPKQKDDKYPFKELATAGIAFKFSEILLENKMTDSMKRNFLELVALATLADMMPQENENQVFIEEGLKSLENSWRPGIKAFFEAEPFKNLETLNQKVSKIISILNIRDVKNRLPANYRLLTTFSLEEAKKIIGLLIEKNELRKEKIKKMMEEVEIKILEKIEEPIIFGGDSAWELTLLSPVASMICHKYQKPAFLFKIGETESQGAVRMPGELNGVEAMKSCSKLLETFGGHPLAAGFRIKNENLEKFKTCLIKYFKKYTN